MGRYPNPGELTSATKTGTVKTLLEDWVGASSEHGTQLDELREALDGGVQGQVLTKASDNPFDFVWATAGSTQMEILPRPTLAGSNRAVVGVNATFTLSNVSEKASAITWSVEGNPEVVSGALTGSMNTSLTVRWDEPGTYVVRARVNGDGTTLNNSPYSDSITVLAQVPSPGNDEYTVFLLHSDSTEGSPYMADGSFAGRGGAQHPIENKGLVHTKEYSYFGKSSIKCPGAGYLQVPGHDDFNFDGDFSIEFLVRLMATGDYVGLFGTSKPGAALRGIQCYATHATKNPGKLLFGITDINGAVHVLRTSAQLTLGQTHHVELVRFNGKLTCFVNGADVGSLTIGNVVIPSDALVIGAAGTDYTGGSPMSGYIEEFRVSKGIARHTFGGFSGPSVFYGPAVVNKGNDQFTKLLLHFNGNSGSSVIMDESYGGRNGMRQVVNNYGVVVDTTMTVNGKVVQPALGSGMGIFDAGYLEVPTNNDFVLGKEWAFEFFLATDVTYGTVAAQWRSGGEQDRSIDLSVSSGVLTVYLNLAGVNRTVATPTPINDGVRRHFAVTCCEDVLRLFVNGEVVATTSAPGLGNVSGMSLFVGLFNTLEGNQLHGSIDEFRFSNGHARFLSKFPVPTQEYTINS